MRGWVVVVKEVESGFEADIVDVGGAYGRTMPELIERLKWMLVESEVNSREPKAD